jgi:hypothetical protein
MADQNIVQTLFGFTPQNVQQQMISAGDQQAMELAKLSRGPVAASAFYGLRAANRIGTNPLFTQNAPQVQKAGQLQQIIQQVQSSGIDMSTPDGLIELANALNTNPEFAGMAVAMRQEANKLAQAQSKFSMELALKGSQITENIAKAGQAEQGRLTERQNARFVELATQGRLRQLSKDEKAELDSLKEIMTIKSPKGANIDIGAAFDKAAAATEGQEQSKAWAQAGDAYRTSLPLLRQIDEVERIVPNAFTGKFAEGKLGLSKALGAIGIPISDKAPDTEYISAISSKLVQQIAKAFPGSLAVKELDQLIKSKPNIAQEAKTIMRLLGDIRDELIEQKVTYEKLDALPKETRYKTNKNIIQGQIGSKLARYREIQRKASSGTATADEAREGIQIKKELGL